RFY
ncbi:hypothetical protein SUGI_0564900, partial [Cryptomeria japonica]